MMAEMMPEKTVKEEQEQLSLAGGMKFLARQKGTVTIVRNNKEEKIKNKLV